MILPMHKTVHGIVIGVVFGALTPLLAWFILTNTFNTDGEWKWSGFFVIVLIYAVLGAIIGTALPKHK